MTGVNAMKVKRYFASDMREAIAKVRAELGSDAVILSNKQVEGGIELVAAMDYEEDNLPPKKPVSKQEQANQYTENKSALFSEKEQQQIEKALTPPSKSAEWKRLFEENLQKPITSPSPDEVKAFTPQTLSSNKARTQGKFRRAPVENKKIGSYANFAYEDAPQTKTTMQQSQNGFADLSSAFEAQAKTVQQHNTAKPRPARSVETPPQAARSHSDDMMLQAMQEEMKALRSMFENQLTGLAWGSFSQHNPQQAELLQRLSRMGMKNTLSEQLVQEINPRLGIEENWQHLLNIMTEQTLVTDDDILTQGGVIALIGSTGVGKTTTVAKLAARYTLLHGAENIALVTTDSFRIGAHEQLKTYGRILGIPVLLANDGNELQAILYELQDKHLVLIDTAGMSQRDIRLVEQMQMLRDSFSTMKIFIVLSAAAQTQALDEVVGRFEPDSIDACIFSKVDEATSLGGALSVIIEQQIPVAFISDGQKVPEDIHTARSDSLLKQALAMMLELSDELAPEQMAMQFASRLVYA